MSSVLDRARTFGRSTGRVLFWGGIFALVLLVIGVVAAFGLYQQSKPIIEREYPTEVYAQTQMCASNAPCNALPSDASFAPRSGANSVHARVSVSEARLGATHVLVKDPNGKVIFDKTYSSTTASSGSDDLTWPPTPGSWSITTSYTGFVGILSIHIDSIGLPPGSL